MYTVSYPNRLLSMRHAATCESDAYDTNAMAQVALANMRKGDTFQLHGQVVTVVSISEKSIAFSTRDRRDERYTCMHGNRWDQLVRDIGGMIIGSYHGVDAGDIMTALRRDPAVHVDDLGIYCLQDA
jgi:hypothetical protein